MKRVFYILPFILLASCQQKKFVCNPQLRAPQQQVLTAAPDTNSLVLIVERHNEYIKEEPIATAQPIISEKKIAKKISNKFSQILPLLLPALYSPKDTLINDPGLKKAKDALAMEEKWLTAFTVFFIVGLLLFMIAVGALPLAIAISEELLLLLLVVCVLGHTITYYGIIVIFLMHIGLFKNYEEEKAKHLKYVLGFFFLPLAIVLLITLL